MTASVPRSQLQTQGRPASDLRAEHHPRRGPHRAALWRDLCLLALTLLTASSCGGSASPRAEEPGTGTARAAAASGEEPADTASTAACAGDECLPCGAGLCPKGFYCDESAPKGPACAWLPKCAKDATCGCLSSALGERCQCSEAAGLPHVECR